MSYDLLIIASDARSVTTFDDRDFAAMEGKYGMEMQDWKDMVNARAPRWRENGTEMIFPAIDRFFANGRNLEVSPEELAAYRASRGDQDLKFLNGLFLADYTTRHGLDVEVINRLPADYSQLDEMMAHNGGPKAVAISTTFIPNRRRVLEIAREIKNRDPEVYVILGGPLVRYSYMIHESRPELASHPLIKSVYYFQDSEPEPDTAVDALVIDARGEQTLVKIVERIKKGEDYKDLANVAYYDDKHELVANPLVAEHLGIEEWQIDWANMPDRFLGPVIAIRGSLGCPLRCKFCSFVVLYPKWDMKGVDYLKSELQKIATRPFIKSVCFSDDNVFLRRTDVDQYSKMMAEAKLPFDWSGYVRVDSITPENIKWIADSRCNGMSIGVESGDTDVLKNMRKIQKPERILRAIDLVNSHGISTASSFIVGFPGETEESVGNTIDLLNNFQESGDAFNWYTAWVNYVVPLTPADKERDKWGLKGQLVDWEHETMNVGEAHRQVQRIHREVTQGAYLAYPFEDMRLFGHRGGHENNIEALKLRHGIAVMDEYGTETFRGLDRAQTMDRLEQIVLESSGETGGEAGATSARHIASTLASPGAMG